MYAAQDPLKSMYDELLNVKHNVDLSAMAVGVSIDNSIAVSEEIYTMPDGTQCNLRDWYDIVHAPFLQRILTSSRTFFEGLRSNIQQLIDNCHKSLTQQHYEDIKAFKEHLEKGEELYTEVSHNYHKFVELTTGQRGSC